MGKGRLRKPEHAKPTRVSNCSRGVLSGAAALVLSYMCSLYIAPGSSYIDEHFDKWTNVNSRLGEPSPAEPEVYDACAAIEPLFEVSNGTPKISCAEFLRDYWERVPLLGHPGAAFSQDLMRLEDVATMIGSWPIRFFKNHATVAMHKPASGFQADFRWKRGDDVPENAVQIAMQEQRTLVMHNLEVYW